MFDDIITKEEAKKMIEELFNAERITLNDWEESFLENLYNSAVMYLTPKRTAKLRDIYHKKLG